YATTILILALLGRLFITGAYYISLQYCPEIFPTVIRGRGVAMAETFGGIAIFVSPIIVYLIEYHPGLPMMILSCLAIFGGVITVILPETKGKSLPQTLQEGEAFLSTANVPPEVKRENQTS
ncbi:Solute carrier family 22 member 13, partial [Armadillidium nasatum]